MHFEIKGNSVHVGILFLQLDCNIEAASNCFAAEDKEDASLILTYWNTHAFSTMLHNLAVCVRVHCMFVCLNATNMRECWCVYAWLETG